MWPQLVEDNQKKVTDRHARGVKNFPIDVRDGNG